MFLFKFIPIMEPIMPENNINKYEIINFIVKGLWVISDKIIERITYIDVNFKPSRYAFDLVLLPKIIVDVRIEMIGINNLIVLVGNIKK